MIEAFGAGDVAGALALHHELLPGLHGHLPHPGRDPDQGRARPARAARRRGAAPARWPPPTRNRRTSCAARPARAARRQAVSHPHPGPHAPPGTLPQRRAAHHPARRPRRDRPQHDGLRVRRPAAHRRLRRAVPRRRPARRRPDPARLRLPGRPARRRPGDRAHPRARGPHRRGAVPAPRSARTSRWSARSSPWPWSRRKLAEQRIDPFTVDGGRGHATARSARSSCEFFAVNHSIPDALAVAIRTAGRAWCCTPATSRWTSCRWTAGSPTWPASPGSAASGVDLLLSDSTNAEIPGFVTPEREIGPVLDEIFAKAPGSASSWPASPRTCTGSSRCSTPR